MKTKKKQIIIICALISFILSGCVSKWLFTNTMATWIGAPLKQFEDAFKDEVNSKTLISQENDITIYRYLVLPPSCYVYWYVNKDGIIVDWRHEGKGCVTWFP